MFQLFKSFVGIGILSIPYAMKLGGLIGGPLGLTCIAILAHHCMQLILETSDSMPGRVVSFGTLGLKLCGRWAKVLVEFSLVLTQFGFCVAYIIFITENICDVVCLETRKVVCPGRFTICVGVLVLLQPVSWLKSLNVLAVPTLMSNLVLLGGILWIYYCGITEISDSTKKAEGLEGFNWKEYPLFFGVAVFTFEGICLVLPIKQAMAAPAELPRQLRETCILLVLLFVSFGAIGYVAYGKNVNSMITFNLPENKISSFLRLFYCLGIFFSYPVCMFPVHNLNESKYECLKGPSRDLHRNLLRTVVVFLSGAIGLSIPNFGLFLGLLGSLACSLLAFVLPALFHLKRIDRYHATRLGDAKDVALIGFGVLAGAVSFTCTIREMFTGSGSETN